jgi:hypothetical protein
MPTYFSYIGKLDSPGFFWNDIPEEAGRTGNTPNRIIPREFSLGLGFAPEAVEYWVKKYRWEGKQLDWGAWGVIVGKADLEAIWKKRKEMKLWTDQEWLEIWEQIEALEDGPKYVLVVAESP